MRVWFLTLFAVAALGCDAARATAPSEAVSWRGAAVSGARVADALPVLEAAWQQTPWDWEPRGWGIMWAASKLACGDAVCGTTLCRDQGITECSGLTHTRTRQIEVSWAAPDPQGTARWELCNARRFDQTGTVADRGCA